LVEASNLCPRINSFYKGVFTRNIIKLGGKNNQLYVLFLGVGEKN
jgi:hypothetical protein